ncbi:MAG: hypothetical protein J6X60_06790, partial [Ruminiclostridium sp.]|nr:hypothetical protein [Ruminiclostridium sp.]
TGFTEINVSASSAKITKALTADLITNNDGTDRQIIVGNGAALTINKGISDGYGSMSIALEKGAKPIVIGKDFNIANSSIKLGKADVSDNFDGDQIFTIPTSWSAEQVNAFFAKVDISGITSGGAAYETKLYNNKGKVTLEAYKFKLEVRFTKNGDVTETYAFWADAIKRIDEIGPGIPTITLLGETTLTKMEMPKSSYFTIKGEKLTLVGITTISPYGEFEICTPVTCTDKKGDPSALTINIMKDGTLYVYSEISCKSFTIKGDKTSAVAFFADNYADSITGIRIVNVYSKLTVNKTLTTDDLNIPENCELIVKSGAAVTINKTVYSDYDDEIGENAVIKLEKGAKPIVIGKNYDTASSKGFVLKRANDTDDFTGVQVFTVPTSNFDFDAFAAKVDISAFQPVGGDYEFKLYNNNGKVTLEAYNFKVGDKTYASWKDAIDAIDKSGEAEAVIWLLADTTLTKMEMPKTAKLTISGRALTLKGVTAIAPADGLTIDVSVKCVDAKDNPAALTITAGSFSILKLCGMFTGKPLILNGSHSTLGIYNNISADSVTGFDEVFIYPGRELSVNKTLTASVSDINGTLVMNNGAVMTANMGIVCEENGKINLTKGAKPIVIGKDFSIEHSIIKLVKANAEDNFEGQQIFTVPTSNFDFDAFAAKVDISAFQPEGSPAPYEVKLYNNNGKVTLEAYKFKVTDGNDDPIGGGVYAFWKDAIDAIDNSGEA